MSKLKRIINILPKSSIQAGNGISDGKYPFYTSSQVLTKYYNDYLYEGNAITMGTGGQASINYCKTRFATSTDCFNFTTSCCTKYVYYYLYSKLDEINDLGFEGAGLKHLQKDYLLNIVIPNIEQKKQTKIADYLDERCSKINKTIEDNKKIIEFLEEYKQSKIDEKLMPKNDWQRIRIKNIAELHGRIGWQGLKASEFIDEGPYLVTGTDFKNGKVNWETCYHISEERYEEAKDIQLKKHDLLITKDGTVGKLAYIENLPNKASLNSHLLLIRPINNICSNMYLYWQLQTTHFIRYYKLQSSGTIMESLTQEAFSNYGFSVPSQNEQNSIINYLGKFCDRLDKVIEYRKQIIEKLEEYKKSLIYEVVTGKKEV